MKIGLVLERFDPQRGGLENWSWQFARRLIDHGHEVHVVACDFAETGPAASLHLHKAESMPSPKPRAAAFAGVLRGLPLDVTHDMGCGTQADIFHPHGGSTVAFRDHNLMRIPRWRQFRLWREKRYREQAWIERRQHALEGSVVVAVSRMVREHLFRLHGLAPERIRLIYNGVDVNRFSPEVCLPLREEARAELGCRPDETLFLQVAHNLRLKNTETIIRALGKIVAQGGAARLAVVGGRRPRPLQKLAQKLGLAGRVTFVDPVRDVCRYYAAGDVYVHPTWYDPCSLVALEALACGLPVITTFYNGVSELMTEGRQGFLLGKPADVAGLAHAMGDLLDRESRTRMGVAARALAMEHTLERQTGEFLDLYKEIAQQRGAK